MLAYYEFQSLLVFRSHAFSRCHNCQATMLEGQAALEEHVIGLAAGAVSAELNGCSLYKGTCSHHDIILIARQGRRHRLHMGIHRRIALNRNTKIAKAFSALQLYSLNNIVACLLRQRLHLIAQLLEHSRRKNSRLHSLQHHMGRKEQALIELALGVA